MDFGSTCSDGAAGVVEVVAAAAFIVMWAGGGLADRVEMTNVKALMTNDDFNVQSKL